MKINTMKSVITYGLIAFMTVVILLCGCNGAPDNKEKTKGEENAETLIESKKELDEAKKEYAEKYKAFKNESNDKISENEKSIASMKADLKSKSKSVQVDLEKKLTLLEQKNQSLKEKIRDFKEDGNEKWESFKVEFKRDMDNLGEALGDLTKNNTK